MADLNVTVSESVSHVEIIFMNPNLVILENITTGESVAVHFPPITTSVTNITFGGNDLQTSSILTSDITMSDIPTKQAKLYNLAHDNASKIPFINYPSRTVTITGTLVAVNTVALDALLDTFKSYLNGQDQNLDVDYNNSTRRFIATVNSTSITRPGGLGYANFSVEFICTSPFGMDIWNTLALSTSARTGASYNDSVVFLGTAPWQLPIITITLLAVTGATTKSLIFGNGTTGQAITVTRTWTAADILIIDCTAKTVTINGNSVSFTGAFPEFPPGAQVLQYTDYFTSRTFTASVVYAVRYL